MSFYGLAIAIVIILCTLQLSSTLSGINYLNEINLEYAQITHIFGILISGISI